MNRTVDLEIFISHMLIRPRSLTIFFVVHPGWLATQLQRWWGKPMVIQVVVTKCTARDAGPRPFSFAGRATYICRTRFWKMSKTEACSIAFPRRGHQECWTKVATSKRCKLTRQRSHAQQTWGNHRWLGGYQIHGHTFFWVGNTRWEGIDMISGFWRPLRPIS